MKKIVICIAIVSLMCVSFNETSAEQEEKVTYNEWIKIFKALKPEMPRFEAEKIIEKVRGTKSNYDLYAMDTSDVVVYKLDEKYILIVWYEPGLPAPTVSTVDGGHRTYPPKDGKYLKHLVTYIR